MIKRTRYSKEFCDAIRNEIVLGQSTLSQVSKRENIASQTLRNWVDEGSRGIQNLLVKKPRTDYPRNRFIRKSSSGE